MPFNPDLVLMWDDDQYENFQEYVVPSYCIVAYERFPFKSPPDNVWGKGETFDLPGHPAAAKMLATRLIEEGFDTAYAYKPLRYMTALVNAWPSGWCNRTLAGRHAGRPLGGRSN
jgi:hypothetical protein